MKIDPGSRVFVDTAALVAVVIPRDSLHSNATEVMTELQSNGTTLVTTEFVLVEFANALSKANFRQTAVALIDDWVNLSSFELFGRTGNCSIPPTAFFEIDPLPTVRVLS